MVPRMSNPRFVLHFAPRSRAARALWLMEESGAPYELALHDIQKGTHKAPEFLALNPDGKLPTLVDRGDGGAGWPVVLAESAAICAYVADLVPASRLAPAIGSPARAPYSFWLTYAGSAFEPAVMDAFAPRVTAPPASSVGWPPLEQVMQRIRDGIVGPYLLGEQFSAADLMIGGMLDWLSQWGRIPADDAPIQAYLTHLRARPALQRARAKEAEILAANG